MSAGSVVTEARRRAELLLAKAREDALSVVESARKTVAELYENTRAVKEHEQPEVVIQLEEPPQPAVEVTSEFPWLADLKNEDIPARVPARVSRPPVAPTPEASEPVPELSRPIAETARAVANDPSAVYPPRKPRRARVLRGNRSGETNGSAS
jgi:hypothetical protein